MTSLQPAVPAGLARRLASMGYELLLMLGVLALTLLLPHVLIGHFLHRLATPFTGLFFVVLDSWRPDLGDAHLATQVSYSLGQSASAGTGAVALPVVLAKSRDIRLRNSVGAGRS